MMKLLKPRKLPKLNPNPNVASHSIIKSSVQGASEQNDEEARLQIVMGLAKWVARGVEKNEFNVLISLFSKAS
jgi:hypothetical protein